jgi:hypothetical protein
MKRWILLVLAAILVSQTTYAEVPKLINYSGKIVDKNGVLLNTGDYDMWFSLWDAPTGGNKIWEEYHIVGSPSGGVRVANGAYNLMLGSVDPIGNSLPMFSQNYYLQVAFHPTTGVPPYETFGRQQIVSVPYALQANDSLRANDALRAADGTLKGSIIMWTGGSCPAGYTRLSSFDGMFPRGASSYGTTGGSDTHSHSGSTQSGGVDHTHNISLTSGTPSATESPQGNGAQPVAGQFHTHTVIGSTAGSSTYLHTHGISSDNNIPKYFNVIFCLKQ